MSFSCYYTHSRSEYKTKKIPLKKKTSVSVVKSDDSDFVTISNKEKVRISIFNKKLNEEISIFIPKYYIFDITYFLKENYLVIKDKDNKINIYITPLIRTLINNMKSFVKKDESLTRSIKERVDSSALRLIRKSVEKSKEITINSKKYIRVNATFKRTDKENHYAIVNNHKHSDTSEI